MNCGEEIRQIGWFCSYFVGCHWVFTWHQSWRIHSESQNLPFRLQRLWILILMNFCTFRRLKAIKLTKFRATKMAKTAFFRNSSFQFWFHVNFQPWNYSAHCGNLRIFLPLRFYVKSILTDFRSSKSAILTILEALNAKNYQKIKIHSCSNSLNGSFLGFKMTKIDFTENSSGIKILKFSKFVIQFGNFRIFLSFRFYVKSILETLKVLNRPFLPFWSSAFC